MSGGGGSSRTVTTQQLAPQQRELLDLVIPTAKEFAANPPELFPRSTIAPFTPLQEQGQQAAVNTAQNFLAPLAQSTANASAELQGTAIPLGTQGLGSLIGGLDTARPAGEFLLSGALLDPNTNPVLGAQTEAAIRPLANTLTRDVLPSIRGGAVEAGQFGGSRQGIAEGIALSDFTQQGADIATNLQANNFNQGLGALQRTLDSFLGAGTAGVQTGLEEGTRSLFAAPTLGDLALRPAGVIESVGSLQQAQEQALLSEEANRFVNEQLVPFLVAQDVANLAFGIPAGSSSVKQSQNLSTLQEIAGTVGLLSAIGGSIAGKGLF